MQERKGMHTQDDQRKSWERFYSLHGDPWRVIKNYNIEELIEGDAFILDLCSGTGKASKPLIDRGFKVILLDFSMNSLRKSPQGTYERVLGDARNLPFKDSLFNVIIASHSLSHIKEKDRIKSSYEIYRVAKEDAILVFEAFTTGDFRYGKGIEIEKNSFLRGNGIYTHYFTKEEVEKLFPYTTIIEERKRHVNRKIFGSIYKMETLIFIAKINKNKKVFIHANHYE